MHIQTGNGHIVALSNLFRYERKQVVMIENWSRHDFMGEIESIFSKNMIPWEDIYFYYRESKEFQKPHLMIVSSVPLKDYPVLTDYTILRDNVG